MGKVYHLNDLEEFFGADDWKLQINVSDIWNQYTNKKISLEKFNNEYYNRFIQYKEDINNLGNDIWNDLNNLLPKLKESFTEEDDLISLYDDLYDWADRNDILIKTK